VGCGPYCPFILALAAADHVVVGVMDEGSFCVGKIYHRKTGEWLEMSWGNRTGISYKSSCSSETFSSPVFSSF